MCEDVISETSTVCDCQVVWGLLRGVSEKVPMFAQNVNKQIVLKDLFRQHGHILKAFKVIVFAHMNG